LVVTHNKIATAAWVSVPDFRDVCKAVDSEIRAEFGSIFAQGRTLDKAMDYVDALSDPRVRGNSWNIGEWCGHVNPGPVQSLVGENKWDPPEMWDRIAAISGRLAGEDCENDPLGPGVIVDETAQLKRGMATAGVGYQYAGCAGGVVNCINWVFLTMAGPFMRTWAGCGLYIPEKSWFTGREETGTARRRGAGIPLGTRFSTKPEIARKLFRRLRENSVRFNFAAGDEVYGRSDALRGDHEKNREAYAYFVPRDFRVEVPGKEKMKVDDLLEHAAPVFEERSAGPGTKGLRYYEWALVALKSPRHFILARRPCQQPWGNPGEPAGNIPAGEAGNPGKRDRVKDEKITFCICFIPAGSSIKPSMRNLVLMAGRRWAAEEGNETGKGPIGWDENQLRKFTSLQKHTALAGLAMLRSNIIMDRLAGRGTAVSQEAPPGNGDVNTAGNSAGKPVALRRERAGEIAAKEVKIPLGDSITPNLAGEELPAGIGYARLSRNEVMRLRNAVMSGAGDSEIAFYVECSNWRRRHQAISKWHHHAKRLSSAALARQPAGIAGPSQKVTRRPGNAGPRRPTASRSKLEVGHSMQ
jgi:SRSO17 transposase